MVQTVTYVTVLMGITGLGGFVPLDGRGEGSKAVLFVDAESRDGVAMHDHDHFVGILVDDAYLKGSERWRSQDVKWEPGHWFFLTAGKRIWIQEKPKTAGLEVKQCSLEPGQRCPKNEKECACYAWVPRMLGERDEVARGDAIVHGRRTRSIEAEIVAGRVSSVLELRDGLLAAGSLGRAKDDFAPVWRIGRGLATDFERVMAESAVLYEHVEGPEVTLCACSLLKDIDSADCPGGCDQTLTLKPDVDGKVKFWVKNQPRTQWFNSADGTYRKGYPNRHFPHLYRLLENQPFPGVPRVAEESCTGVVCPYPPDLEALLEAPPPTDAYGEILYFAAWHAASNPQCPGADYGGG